VVRSGPARVPDDVMSGVANAVLVCDPCCDRLEDLEMKERGFRVAASDPRLVPMVVWGQITVWRRTDGRYSLKPPDRLAN
jgi:hypothetical protein